MRPQIFGRALAGAQTYFLPTRSLSCSAITRSGHNRWSKIKHDKGKEDAIKSKARGFLSEDVTMASRCAYREPTPRTVLTALDGGPDPNLNSRLGIAIANAKRGQLSKTSIEAAIARGQGKSLNGAPLEAVVIEAMLPSTVAAIIECQTESKAKTLQDVRMIITRNGGTVTPTSFFFDKKGKVVFQEQDGIDQDKAMDEAIMAGATDFAFEDGKLFIETEPSEITAVSDKLSESMKLQIERAEIVYDAKEETLVALNEEQGSEVRRVVDLIEADMTVQNVYTNAA
jgi:transcriptional/translational regulatory protein YebC/TACO1